LMRMKRNTSRARRAFATMFVPTITFEKLLPTFG